MKRYILTLLILCALHFYNIAQSPATAEDIQGYKEKVEKLDEQISRIYWIIGISGAVLTVFGFLFQKSIESKLEETKEAYVKQLHVAINEKEKTVNAMIDKVNIEQRLWTTKRIYIWGETDNDILLSILRKSKFNMSNIITDEEDAAKGFDVLLINNNLGELTDDEMIRKVKQLPDNTLAFYFNTSRKLFNPPKGHEDKVNFVNSPAQLYGNLMNTLKYQDKLA